MQKRIWHLTILETGVFKVQRFYNSVIPYYGTAGRKWRFSFESRIIFHDEKQKADVFCVDGHTESFLLTEEGYVNKKGGSRAYHLEAEEGEGFLLLESQGRKVYHYGLQGQLLSVTDRIGNRMEIRYNGILAEKSSHSAGMKLGLPMKTAEWRSFGTRRVVSSSTNTGNAA